MKFLEFKAKVHKFPFFTSNQLTGVIADKQVLRNQLYRWQKKGLVIKLKKGLYVLVESERKIEPSRPVIAAQLVSPSYISVEYALGYYGLIPERVMDVTSVTTKKTKSYQNGLGTFSYQHIKDEAFRGFKQLKDDNGFSFFMAEPEKALVDFFYLNSSNFKIGDSDVFEESYRFQNTDDIKPGKLIGFAKIFESEKLMKVVEAFLVFLKSQR